MNPLLQVLRNQVLRKPAKVIVLRKAVVAIIDIVVVIVTVMGIKTGLLLIATVVISSVITITKPIIATIIIQKIQTVIVKNRVLAAIF